MLVRILFLTQWFDPEPAFKGLVFAKALENAGQQVEVLTGFPNYPDGKLYPNYGIKWSQKETLDGIKVHRVPLYPSHNSSAVLRILNYVTFAVSSCFYGIFAMPKFDVIYVYHPPLTAALSAALIGLTRRTPFVVDVNDLWPDTLAATGMIKNKYLLALVGKICQWMYRRASHIVVGTPSLRYRLIECSVPDDKITIIYNWCDEQALRLTEQGELKDRRMVGRFNVVFAGNMGKAQALEAAILAAKRVQTVNSSIQFVFVGGGVEVDNLKRLVIRLQVKNILFVPRMPMHEIGKVLASADVLFVHLKDDPLFEMSIPSKTQAYMCVGKPILMAVKGDAADLITKSGAGFTALPENDASIAEVVLKMACLSADSMRNLGTRGAEYYFKNLALAVGSNKFLSVFKAVVKTSAR